MGVFDIIGPVMVGPSSSHTAGAVRIGQMAALVFNNRVKSIEVEFHGSFACTYKGHGTDRAIIGGILGMSPDDEQIISSLETARKRDILFKFSKVDLGDVHPNSVRIILGNEKKNLSLIGSSVGGGDIVISKINEYDVNLKGKLPTLWVLHQDKLGEIAAITSFIEKEEINIAFMRVFRKDKGGLASSIIELDQKIDENRIGILEKHNGIIKVRVIPSLL